MCVIIMMNNLSLHCYYNLIVTVCLYPYVTIKHITINCLNIIIIIIIVIIITCSVYGRPAAPVVAVGCDVLACMHAT